MSQSPATPAGCRVLIERLDQALGSTVGPEARTRAVRDVLTELIHNGSIELPSELTRPSPDGYARRLIHTSERLGYVALAMVWGPGQGTPLHDHAGLWCVEGVLTGQIAVSQYDLVERQGPHCRFVAQGCEVAGVGSAGRLIPPFDYHTIANASPDQSSITIHVYGGEMSRCSIFLPLGDGWFEETERVLKLTA